MSDRNLLKVMKGSSVQSTTDLANGERFLILTSNGYKAMTKAAAQALFGGGGGGSPITRQMWDAKASEVPLGLIPYISPTLAGQGVTYSGNEIVFPVNSGAETSVDCYIQGNIPMDAPTWFYLAPTAQPAVSMAGISLQYVDSPDEPIEAVLMPGSGLGMPAPIMLQVSGETWTVEAGEHLGILVAIDPVAYTVTFWHGSKSVIVPIDAGRMGDLYFNIIGSVMAPGGGDLTLKLSNFPWENQPAPTPTDHLEFIPVQPVKPAVPEGTYLEIFGDPVRYNLVNLKAGNTYVSFDDGLLELPNPEGFASLDKLNKFTKALYLDRGVFNSAIIDVNYQYSHFWGDANTPLATAFQNNYVQWSTVLGAGAATGAQEVNYSVIIGSGFSSADVVNTSIAIGHSAAARLKSASTHNVTVGNSSLTANKGANNTAVGQYSADLYGFNLQSTVAVGAYALRSWTDPLFPTSDEQDNLTELEGLVAIGANAMSSSADPYEHSVAIGYNAMWDVAGDNGYTVAIGDTTLATATDGLYGGVVIGAYSARNWTGGDWAVAIGYGALENGNGDSHVAIGAWALNNNNGAMTGNTAVGTRALEASSEINYNTAIGYEAMRNTDNVNNSTAIGNGATVTGSDQVQLGNSSTTTYAFGAIQNRSDKRDKTDIGDTALGLEFILGLRPVDYVLDMRDDYIDWASYPQAPEALRPEPRAPLESEPEYEIRKQKYEAEMIIWQRKKAEREEAMMAYHDAVIEWSSKNDISKIEHDGTHKRNRKHHGFIAQEVKALADAMGIDFGGFQDHLLNGGKDVKSLGYEEFIAPLVKAVQELNARLSSSAMIDLIAEAVLKKMREQRQ